MLAPFWLANMICSQCKTAFSCTSKKGKCWCFSLPAILPVKKGQDCLCKDCLINKINAELETLYQTKTNKELVQLAAKYQNQFPVAKLDYYLNEEGFRVMTKWAHLKRGYCCGNGCKHCAYRNDNVHHAI